MVTPPPLQSNLSSRLASSSAPAPRPHKQMRSIHAFLKLQADLEALELSFHGERPPLPGSSVLPVDTRNPKPPPAAAAAPGSEGKPSSDSSSSEEHKSCSVSGGGSGASWSLPCVSVDAEGNSYFSDKTMWLGAGVGAGSGIGALSELIPTTG